MRLHTQVLVLGFALFPPFAQAAQTASTATLQAPQPATLNNASILKMTKAGLEKSLLLQIVQTQPGSYEVGPDDLIALKNAGVSQAVISAMVARASGLSTHPPTAAVDGDSSDKPVLDDIGVYYKATDSGNSWKTLAMELITYRSGGALKSAFTNGIVKQDRNGRLKGPASSLELHPGDQILIYAPEGTAPEEYVLLKFRQHSDNREFRAMTGNVFHQQQGADRDAIPFTATKIALRMYGFTLPKDLAPGEYGILPPGSANQQGITMAGKIYTFSIMK